MGRLERTKKDHRVDRGLGVRFTCWDPEWGPRRRRFRPGSLPAPQVDLTEYPAPSTVVMSEHTEAEIYYTAYTPLDTM